MSGPDPRPPSSAQAAGDSTGMAQQAEANAEYARRMHLRQIFRRTLVTGVIVAIVGLAALVGVPLARHLRTQWFLNAQGFRVVWDLDADNWTSGGVTDVGYNQRSWSWSQELDPAIPSLHGLFNVRSLSLTDCPVSEQALQGLSGLVQLQELDLTRLNAFRRGGSPGAVIIGSAAGRLSDACVLPLLGLRRLRMLSLAGNQITDAGLEQIGQMTRLEELDLEATEITDAGLVHLQSLKRLKTLNLAATRVTPAGMRNLQNNIPGLEISLEIDPEIEQNVKNWRSQRP